MIDRMLRVGRPGAVATAVLMALAARSDAQPAPSTDIHLVPLRATGGSVAAGAAENVTARTGYDNQPAFTADGRSILFTSVREGGQSDIYRFDIATKQTVQVTRTPESEYSATLMPGGRGISVIRVEADSAQRLWSFALDGSDPQLVLRDVKPVGYHAWANDSVLGLFVLGSPATLQFANARTGVATTAVGGIGRSLHRIPGDRIPGGSLISFVHKESATEWWIKALAPGGGQPLTLVKTLEGSEDYAWLPDGSALMALGNTLFHWTPPSSDWKPIATFTQPSLQRITRLAVSPNGEWVALVSAEVARP